MILRSQAPIFMKNILNHIIARQFRKPSGLLGLYSTAFMKRNNTPRIEWAIAECDIQPADTALEIGFGPGIGIGLAAAKLTTGKLYGVDMSRSMVRAATRRNRRLLQSGKVALVYGSLSPAPFPDCFFDRVFGVNIIYFWPDPGMS